MKIGAVFPPIDAKQMSNKKKKALFYRDKCIFADNNYAE
jgi:hypothetical protein